MEPKSKRIQKESQQPSKVCPPHHNFTLIRRIPLGLKNGNVENDPTGHLEPLDFIVPRNRIINQHIIPLVDEALDRRHQLMINFKRQTREALQERERRQMELEDIKERILKLTLTNEDKRKVIEEMERRKTELQKQILEFDKQKRKVEKLRSDKDRYAKQLQDILDEKRMYEEFEKEMGISYGGKVSRVEGQDGDDGEQLYLITVTKIHQNFPDDPYYIYFSSFDFTKNGIFFTPVDIDPKFAEFESLKGDFINSTDAKGFINLVSDYWKRDSRGKGAPRLSIPRKKSQEKEKTEGTKNQEKS